MSFCLDISNEITFPVVGEIQVGEVAQPFDFKLIATRMTSDELRAETDKLSREYPLAEILKKVVKGWASVTIADGSVAAYTPEAFARLIAFPGLASLTFSAYNAACSARAREGN